MDLLRYTLIGDGSSDKALLPVINWLLNDLYPNLPIVDSFAEFGHLPKPPAKKDIAEQIECAAKYYPFDILFYHRDAEENTDRIIDKRKEEILGAAANAHSSHSIVCVVPVVMTETWLLIDENAIKKAAGNRNFSGELRLPPVQILEQKTNTKSTLYDLLKVAKNTNKRSLQKFKPDYAVHLVAEFISDFSPLRQLRSFRALEQDLKAAIEMFQLRKA